MSRPESVEARPWRRPNPPRRVLVVRLQALGDTVLTLPYLKAFRRLLPEDATLDMLTRREVAGIPGSVELFDRVFEIGGGRSARRQAVSAAALLPRLWLRRYQVVVDLQRNRVSRLLRKALHPPAWSEFDRFSPRLAGERTRATLDAVGLGPIREVRPDLVLRRPDAGLDRLREAGWDGSTDLVVLNPAGAFPGRRWPLASYARFAALWDRSSAPSARYLVLGLPTLAPEARRLKDHLGSRLLDLVGRTTAVEAFALLRRATLVLSEDSGLMHMAWVAGAPTLGLFGASRGVWARPHGSHSAWIGACELPDGACLEGTCRRGEPTCLERLAPETVLERARELVDDAEGAPGTIYADGRAWAPPLGDL